MGNCTYNNKCKYAHRQDELQPISNHPFLKLFFAGHITMMEFVTMEQSVNLFMNYRKKSPRKSVTTTCHFGSNIGSKYQKLAPKLNSNPHSATLFVYTWIIALWPILRQIGLHD